MLIHEYNGAHERKNNMVRTVNKKKNALEGPESDRRVEANLTIVMIFFLLLCAHIPNELKKIFWTVD